MSLEIRMPGQGRAVPMVGKIRNRVCTRDHVEAGILFKGFSSGLAGIFASLDDRGGK